LNCFDLQYLWLIFNIWKYTPLGVMWTAHGNFFINGGSHNRATQLPRFAAHLRDKYWRFDYRWIVMYPEGSRLFLIQDSSAAFAAKHELKQLMHCALPRSAAAHVVVQTCGPKKNGKPHSNGTGLYCSMFFSIVFQSKAMGSVQVRVIALSISSTSLSVIRRGKCPKWPRRCSNSGPRITQTSLFIIVSIE
jgi:hypothetical protein